MRGWRFRSRVVDGAAEAGYEVRVKSDTGIIFEDGYGSIDRVLRPDNFQFYSSKPPLFSTLIAGLYWLLQTLFGWSLDTRPERFAHYHPAEVVRTILFLVNVVPFAIYLLLLGRLTNTFGKT